MTFKETKKAIFFDLDHTIWDFDKNALETLSELYYTYKFDELLGISTPDKFVEVYNRNNQALWALYNVGKIDKASLRKLRFHNTFLELEADPEAFPTQFEVDYLRICPHKTNLFPQAHETLSYLQERYPLHLISNGFVEACNAKVDACNLRQYFQSIIISEEIGVLKPDPRIYQYALEQAKAPAQAAVMIGDNLEADVKGAIRSGIDAVYFNPEQKEVPQDIPLVITSLQELQHLL